MFKGFALFDRIIATANYGAIGSFTRPDTPPASSATVLVTQTSYNDGGEPSQVTDPMGYVMQTTYDDAGRTTQTVEAYGSGSDRTTNFTYTLDSLIATMTAVNPTTGNQTTTWIYGTTLADSGVARNDLLRFVDYPDATGWAGLSTDNWATMSVDDWSTLPVGSAARVAYAYNRLGQQTSITDQRGTVRSLLYDTLGRLTDDCVTAVGSNTDNAVLRISRGYEVRGMVSTITSYDDATPGSGTISNQVQFTYNAFGQLTTDQQSHSGAVGGGTPSVQYVYDSGGSSSNEIRLNELIYPTAGPSPTATEPAAP